MKHNLKSPINSQQGVTLIEVLVSVLVLGVGLLGVAGLQTTSIKNTNSSYERTMSMILTENLVELMRSNPNIARTGGYSLTDCTGSTALLTDSWVDSVKAVTTAETCPVVAWDEGDDSYTVTITWSDDRLNSGNSIVMQVLP
ncbi:type IV pilus modification protein PilV [Rheinheimera salexigens]|uniref:Type IV pilus modification protein PilV n=1 Tax=Rheinheimera salexigens TaxID=1628148 RepID=A0A1E7Q9D2_9GAMM|nr:type IV pilus modification protein PilV [Rheinheimera salexigens]OEY70711.1 type IV pilus modification protein PilV [Rheinheimera salexigens]